MNTATKTAIDRGVALLALVCVWQIAASRGWIDQLLIGSPMGIAVYLRDNLFKDGALLIDFGWTMLGTLISFVLGMVAAVVTGVLFVMSPRLERAFEPILAAVNSMPRIALAPLFLIWFGLGLASKIAIGFSLCYFIVLSSTVAGGRSVSQDHLTLASTLGASAWRKFVHFTLPTAVPTIFTGLRLGLVYSLLGVVGGEIIASEHGLGQQLSLLSSQFNTNGVLGILLLLALTGASINGLMNVLENTLLRWR
ncbi:ABC transporter permease [Paraburkholderia susongensis]|uniref:NitT/TauT family transport system permease protein n=1 Tax=Paraburkholderia susongensis TaxID=1515439 RepID=A0A1X7LIE0_9BURK|nr:ABC transporter permease [Paraburkholderia susongensis]SMG52959.1 NitT/TauT family transport system permease protein [Paraburkholderia susongensis]